MMYLVILSLALAPLIAMYGPAYAQSAGDIDTVRIGVLVPSSDLEAAAIRHSISDANEVLEATSAGWRIEAVYPDDNTSFAEFIVRSSEDGIVAFVGPGDVASLLRAKEVIADIGGNAVYMGCCVPATHHHVLDARDNVFVLAPDLLDQAAAVAAAMENAGIEHAIPVYSGGVQSSQLRTSIATHFDGVMDLGVLIPHGTIDYSPAVSAIYDKIESADGEVAILVLEPGSTQDLMAASSALTDVTWFGTGSEVGLPDFDEGAQDFAERVGYMIPRFESVHTHFLNVNYIYTPEEWSAYDAVQLIAYTLSDPTVNHVPFFGMWSYMLTQAPPESPNASDVATALPIYAAAYGGAIGNTELNSNGGLKSATHMLYGMADGTWLKRAVYNPPTSINIGSVAIKDTVAQMYRFEPTHSLHDVHTVGALFPLSGSLAQAGEQRLTAARLAISTTNHHNNGFGLDWYADIHIEDTRADPDTALEKIKRLDRLGIKMVVGPSTSSNAAAVLDYANENDIILLSPSTSSALSIPGDNMYRISPPSINEVTVLTKLLEMENKTHVVVIHRQDLYGSNLVQGLTSEFSGSLNLENGYSPELANDATLDYDGLAADVARDVQALVDAHGESPVAVLLVAFDESASVLEAAAHHPVLESVQWYASAGHAKRPAVVSNDAALAFADRVGHKGPILMIDDAIPSLGISRLIDALHPGEQIDPYAYVTYDMVFVSPVAASRNLTPVTAGPILSDVIERLNVFTAGDGGLDENGDLANTDYDIWQIEDGRWHNTLVYDSDREKFIREVVVGLPMSFSGIQSDVRVQRSMAFYIAEQTANQLLERRDADWRLVLEFKDTAGDPQTALKAVKSMHEKGISLLLGLQTDADVDAVRQYVAENDMLVLTCCSTSQDLSHDDHIFRLAPDNTRETEALGALFKERGTESLVVVYRDDAFGSSMSKAVVESFGGRVVEIPYDSELANREALDYGALSAQIAGVIQDMTGEGEDSVAVLLIGFSESADVLSSASEYPVLESVKWYGTSGATNRPAIVADSKAAAFAEAVEYEATLFAEPPPVPAVVDTFGLFFAVPNTYVYSTFDTVTLMAAAIGFADSEDARAVAAVLPTVAEQVSGTLGSLTLNSNGDLDRVEYDIWRILDGVWSRSASYNPDTGLTVATP
jgi:branched-chain amino acid transport system substrate-binding protein